MKIYTQIAIALMLLMLVGCAGKTIAVVSEKIQTDSDFNQIVLADVEQAILLARETNDLISLKCWQYIRDFTLKNSPPDLGPAGNVVGALSTYQKARNIRRTVIEIKISDEFRLECGPMLMDSLGALGRLGIRVAI